MTRTISDLSTVTFPVAERCLLLRWGDTTAWTTCPE